MSAIEYAGIPLDGSASSTRALTARLGETAARLARRRGTTDPPPPDDEGLKDDPPTPPPDSDD